MPARAPLDVSKTVPRAAPEAPAAPVELALWEIPTGVVPSVKEEPHWA